MEPVSKLFDTLNGRPAVVIGGGPSSPDDLKMIPNDCFKIGVNHHCKGLVEPDLIVALDGWQSVGSGYGLVGKKGNLMHMMPNCPIVGQNESMAYSIFEDGKPLVKRGINKSCYAAVEIALSMGAGVVYLAGIDCYLTGMYWYDKEAPINPKFETKQAKELELKRWKQHYGDNDKIRSCSGPLLEIFNGVQ